MNKKGRSASLILKRASTSRPSGEWNDDDFDVLANGVVIGRIMKAAAIPEGRPWLWTLAFGHHGNRRPTHVRNIGGIVTRAWFSLRC